MHHGVSWIELLALKEHEVPSLEQDVRLLEAQTLPGEVCAG